MAQDNAASIAGAAMRLTRLNSDGTLTTGPSASYVTRTFISVSITPEYEDGDEFVQKSASGTICATYKSPDTLKRVSLEIAICDPDPEFTEMAAGGVIYTEGGQSLGWASPEVGADAVPNGVAIEVWSNAIAGGKPTGQRRYFHWLFPYAIMRQGGDRVIENDILATSFEGYSLGNDGFGEGPAAPLWPFITDRAYAYVRTDSIPSGNGYQAVTVTP